MPRKQRAISSTDIYHIIIRSVNQQQIFEDNEDFLKCIYILEDCQKKYDFTIHGYCLMGNHIHLLITADKSVLSSIFQSFGTRFVRWYNIKYQRFGHLFQERYTSIPIEDDSQFLCALDYIQKNPVKAHMVRYASEYPWSSFNAYYGKNMPLVETKLAIGICGSIEALHNFFAHNEAKKDFEQLHEPSDLPLTISDTIAQKLITQISDCKSPSDFQKLPKALRNKYIIQLLNCGLGTLQLSRLCGIPRTTLYRLLEHANPQIN